MNTTCWINNAMLWGYGDSIVTLFKGFIIAYTAYSFMYFTVKNGSQHTENTVHCAESSRLKNLMASGWSQQN